MPSKEIVTDIPEWIRVFKDGTVERPRDFRIVPPTLNTGGGGEGLSSKDISISRNPPKPISARIYLPNIIDSQTKKLPIYVYFHGGGFFFESAFSKLFNDHFLKLVPEAKVIVVSVEYRLAPEHPLPAAYDDCWDALKWVASHSTKDTTPNNTEPWLTEHGDFSRVFIGGDSAGANIVHNILAFRVGPEPLPGDVQILGSILAHPYFYGSKPVGSEPVTGLEENFFNLVWKLVYPSAPGGIDNPFINPLSPGAPSLAELACSRMLVCVAEKDGLRDRGVWYYEAVKKSGWKGEIQLFEGKDEDHVYHLLKPTLNQDSHKADELIKLMASFLVN